MGVLYIIMKVASNTMSCFSLIPIIGWGRNLAFAGLKLMELFKGLETDVRPSRADAKVHTNSLRHPNT